MGNRVVVTGAGIVSPIGIGKARFWRSLLRGDSGVDFITLFDASSFPNQIAAEIKNFDPADFLSENEYKFYSRATQFALVAAKEAVRNAGGENLGIKTTSQVDVYIGSGMGSFSALEEEVDKNPEIIRRWDRKISPLAVNKVNIFSPAAAIAGMLEAEGRVTTVSAACASGINAIGMAAERIESGKADIAICGGTDTPITRFVLEGFCAAKALTTENSPGTSLRPLDATRTKYALGEGSGIFILEPWDRAVARGARPFAEITGFAEGTENVNELFLLDKTGEKWAKTIRKLLGGESRFRNFYVNGHFPSDKVIDSAEIKALRRVINRPSRVPVTSIKANVGSGMSAAGVAQFLAALLSVYYGRVPGVLNFRKKDNDNEFIVIGRQRKMPVQDVIINSHGVGGVNSSIRIKKVKKWTRQSF